MNQQKEVLEYYLLEVYIINIIIINIEAYDELCSNLRSQL